MPRPCAERFLGSEIAARAFKPAGVPASDLERVALATDEAEALRLADLEGLYQEAAARSMGVSRQTFGRIVERARRKVADAVLNGKVLVIEGGKATNDERGGTMMKIALPARDGMIDAHFGHCQEFRVYSVGAGGALAEEAAIPSGESCGCKSGVAAILAKAGVTHLVAGNMGQGAVNVLRSHGIEVLRGAEGPVLEVATAFAGGRLADSGAGCAGHGDDHRCDHR